MLNNYLLLALRNLRNRPGYSLLNLSGLALGMACCLAILQYVRYERSYDRNISRADDIYRLWIDCYQKDKFAWKSATIYPAYGPTVLREFPEVDATCRLHDAEAVFSNPARDVKFAEKKGYYADNAFLDVFEIPLSAGNAAEALTAPGQIVLSESLAQKLFGDADVVGQSLQGNFNGWTTALAVSGIFKHFPDNSHLDVDYLVSMPTLGQRVLTEWRDTTRPLETSWGWYDFYTYVRLRPGADHAGFLGKLPAFTEKYVNSRENATVANIRNNTYAQRLTDIHLYSELNQEAEVNGDGKAVGLLLLVALFILGIAWVNYLNLATARATERAREVGVRKVSGATRGQLIRQFMTESLLLNAGALLIAFFMVWLAQPALAELLNKKIPMHILVGASSGWMLAVFTLGTLLSGFYPALVLSGFKPVSILKGAFKTSSSGVNLRRGLIVGQFAVSIAMLVGIVVVTRQVKFMRSQDPGFDRAQTLVLQGPATLVDSVYQNVYTGFKNEVLQMPGIARIAGSSSVPGEEIYWTSGFRRMQSETNNMHTLYILGIDAEFTQSYDLKILAGRNFETTDRQSALLNATAATLLGFSSPEAAIGQKIMRGRRDTLTVRGVIGDFHHQGLQKAVDPMCVRYAPEQHGYYSVKINAGSDLPGTLSRVEAAWKTHFPADPFSYFFLDEYFDRQYKADLQFGKVFGLFTLLAMFIACLGLFGLASYVVMQRTKEIGIRKVLGASVEGITRLLAMDFLKLVFVAILIATPVAWYFMRQWLSDFAYHIELEWWMFALAGLAAVLIAFLTVSLQSIRAALANPVKSLRSE
ncbi:MAG: ABC transporter permease [Saprospiraceae bacterium]|nr:ABC transporter permease [Saprospiraceae bacterium]